MSVQRYLLTKAINLLLVLIAVLIITAVLYGATGLSDQVLRSLVDEELRGFKQGLLQQPGLSEEEFNRRVAEYEQQLIITYGLDKPWYLRMGADILRILTLDLGTTKGRMYSFSGSDRVSDIILERIPYTVILVTTATIVVFTLGLLFGVWLSTKTGTLWDRTLSLYGAISYAAPTWWLAMVLIMVFAYQLRLFPPGGLQSPNLPDDPFIRTMDIMWHAFLPVATLVLASLGSAIYVYRSILVSTANEDFVLVGRAKGLPERTILTRYIIRPSLHPILTNLVLGLAGSLTGAILTETVFGWPGMGLLYYEAIISIIEPLILGLTYIFTLIYVVARFILEVLYIIVDPRVKV